MPEVTRIVVAVLMVIAVLAYAAWSVRQQVWEQRARSARIAAETYDLIGHHARAGELRDQAEHLDRKSMWWWER
jgi:predicted negative regulator of RcsB-dependent stress response